MDRLTELAAARASGDITASMLLPPRAPGQPAILEFEEVLLLLPGVHMPHVIYRSSEPLINRSIEALCLLMLLCQGTTGLRTSVCLHTGATQCGWKPCICGRVVAACCFGGRVGDP